jgi:hypothetical protein
MGSEQSIAEAIVQLINSRGKEICTFLKSNSFTRTQKIGPKRIIEILGVPRSYLRHISEVERQQILQSSIHGWNGSL